jgi:hypothetical protein
VLSLLRVPRAIDAGPPGLPPQGCEDLTLLERVIVLGLSADAHESTNRFQCMSTFALPLPALIYTTSTHGDCVKFVYCPKCKELRVKPWYSFRAFCSRCRDDGREIPVPRTAYTFALYALILVVFALVYLYTNSDNFIFLISAIAGLVAAFIIQAVEISRGERFARAKIKATKSDAAGFKQKGWL